jgi:hypothetical protein
MNVVKDGGLTNMRKAAIGIVVILAFLIGFAYLRTGVAGQSARPTLTKNGRIKPSSVPDYIAFGFFFRSLVTAPLEGDKGYRRIEAFAKRTGIKDSQIEPLLTEAQNLYQQVSQYDKQIKAIKDHTWPDPEAETWSELREIENQKKAAIIEEVNALLMRRVAETETKLRAFIAGHIKRRIVGFRSEPNPGQHKRPHHAMAGIVLAALFPPIYSVNTQMSGDETVYIYVDAAFTPGDEIVYGYGDVQATAGSYGHEYSSRTEFYGPCGQFQSNNGVMPIDNCDGEFSYYSIAVQSCPISNTSGDAGGAGDSTVVEPFIRVNSFGTFNNNPATAGLPQPASDISLSITASQHASASINIEYSYVVVSGAAPISISIAGSGTSSISGGTTVSRTASYFPLSVITDPTRIKADAIVTANTQVINNHPISASILTYTSDR